MYTSAPSLYLGGGGMAKGGQPVGGGGGLEDGIAIISPPPSHLLCTIKSQMGGPWCELGGGGGAQGPHASP